MVSARRLVHVRNELFVALRAGFGQVIDGYSRKDIFQNR